MLAKSAALGLLGLAAYPGAEKAHLLPVLFGGMGTSVAVMALPWSSYEVERRTKSLGERGVGSARLRQPR